MDCNLKVIKCRENAGKGHAVKIGMLNSSGEILLFADADNATQVNSFESLEQEIDRIKNRGLGVTIGSRNHNRADILKERKPLRQFLGKLFVTWNKIVCWTHLNVSFIKDTQCGFKLFTRQAAQKLFLAQHLERWSFDLELIYLCSP